MSDVHRGGGCDREHQRFRRWPAFLSSTTACNLQGRPGTLRAERGLYTLPMAAIDGMLAPLSGRISPAARARITLFVAGA